MLDKDCWEDADTDKELKKFSDDMKAVSENPNFYDKLNEEDKQRILMKDIVIQARFLKKLFYNYFNTITTKGIRYECRLACGCREN